VKLLEKFERRDVWFPRETVEGKLIFFKKGREGNSGENAVFTEKNI